MHQRHYLPYFSITIQSENMILHKQEVVQWKVQKHRRGVCFAIPWWIYPSLEFTTRPLADLIYIWIRWNNASSKQFTCLVISSCPAGTIHCHATRGQPPSNSSSLLQRLVELPACRLYKAPGQKAMSKALLIRVSGSSEVFICHTVMVDSSV